MTEKELIEIIDKVLGKLPNRSTIILSTGHEGAKDYIKAIAKEWNIAYSKTVIRTCFKRGWIVKYGSYRQRGGAYLIQ